MKVRIPNGRVHSKAWESISPTQGARTKRGSPYPQFKWQHRNVGVRIRNSRGDGKAWESVSHGCRRQPMCNPEGCATVLGAVGGGPPPQGGGRGPLPPPPLVDPNLRVGGSGGQPPGPTGGSVGTPTHIPQNDPHDTLIILNMHKWGKIFFQKNQVRLPSPNVRPGGWVWVKILFCAFQPFLNSPQNSEHFEYRHIGSNKKISPWHMPKTKSPAPLVPTKHISLYNHFGVCRGGGRVLTRIGPRAVSPNQEATPKRRSRKPPPQVASPKRGTPYP